MKTHWRHAVVAVGALVAVMYAGVAAAAADEAGRPATSLTLSAPSTVGLGDTVPIVASLQDESGHPVEGGTIQFFTAATFMSVPSGLLKVGQASTDEAGQASTSYKAKRSGTVELRAEYAGDAVHAPAIATVGLTVLGNHQLYQTSSGVRVPFVNKWMLVGVLGLIWGLYVFVVAQVLRVALKPHQEERLEARR